MRARSLNISYRGLYGEESMFCACVEDCCFKIRNTPGQINGRLSDCSRHLSVSLGHPYFPDIEGAGPVRATNMEEEFK